MEKYLVIDTETANSIDDPLTYDIGFAVVDENGTVYETHSYAIAEIFLDKDLMSSAYYAEKIPAYWEEIKQGTRELKKLETVRKILIDVCKKYNIVAIVAHNARFDYKSTAISKRYITSSKQRYFLPYGIEIWDTLKMSREVFKNDVEYNDFCTANNYLTKNGKCRFTAEILYRFLTKDTDFIEAHTGLADVLIEKEILIECLKRNCQNKKLWEN